MARYDRNPSSRPAPWRGNRWRDDKERFRTHYDDRADPRWDDRTRSLDQPRQHDDYGSDDWNRGRRDLGGAEFTLSRNERTATSRWNPDRNDDGGYYQTGSYIDDGGAWQGFGREFERARARVQGQGDYDVRARERDRDTNGPFADYSGRSAFGPARDSRHSSDYDAAPWHDERVRDYEHRSSWDYGRGDERASRPYDSSFHGAGNYDARSARSFRGRGPQGYQRSDERLREMICERLTDHPAIDASNVSVEVSGQIVKLTGTVEDRRTKYEMEELIEGFSGVKDIDNQVRVRAQRSNEWDPGSVSTSRDDDAAASSSIRRRS